MLSHLRKGGDGRDKSGKSKRIRARMISAKPGKDGQSNKRFAGYMRGRWVMGYAVGADMRLNCATEIAANWDPCITLDRGFYTRLLMKLEKGMEEKDWAWKEGRKLCQRVRLLLLGSC